MTQRLWWRLIDPLPRDRADRWAKHPSQVACISEDLKCWGAWNTTCRHKAKDITPSVTWMRDAGKRKRSTIFLERMRKGNSQSDEHWNGFKGNFGQISDFWDGVECTGAFSCAWIPSWTELGREFREERHSWRLINPLPTDWVGGWGNTSPPRMAL